MPVWVPFAALLAVLMIVSITAAAVYGVVKATDPSIKSADDLPDGAVLALTFFQDLVFVFGAMDRGQARARARAARAVRPQPRPQLGDGAEVGRRRRTGCSGSRRSCSR